MKALTKRHHGLDATRGACALLVAAYHFMLRTGLGHFYSIGLFAVYTFFILSSVTLCIVYGEEFSEAVSGASMSSYALNRMARILPLLSLVALITFAYRLTHLHTGWNDVGALFFTATGLLAFGPPGFLSSTMGAWSLGIEILFYFLFPVLCLLLIRRTATQLLIICAIALVVQNIFSEMVLRGGLEQQWSLYVSPLAFIFYFVSGFAIYRIRFSFASSFYIGLALILIAACVSVIAGSPSELLLVPPKAVLIPLTISIGTLLVFNSQAHPKMIGVFEFIGAISYSSYLFHPLIYSVTSVLYLRLQVPLLIFAIVFGAATIIISYGSYRLFELPARNWIRRNVGNSEVAAIV